MRIAIASDHAGYFQKQALVKYLEKKRHIVCDLGPANDERVDYPDYAQAVALAILANKADGGVLICGTGIGMSIAANKIAGIRAANVTTPEFAKLAREHNDANILALSARFISVEDNQAIIDAFFGTDFVGGRHGERLAKISELEKLR
ncbi:MAG: ribose 5-phosphate isomerase B [Coriobacteriales bacterium]|jgi:ribose 5-phosphate isomerase B|nr:ribose 5-phosphate isomerase B [Coriobacteriales bacterium]